MTTKNEYKTISKKSQKLLQKEEGFEVEFKQSFAGIDSSDLVAFANSELGGTILIGVKEVTFNGKQQGKVIGCEVSDHAKLSIINRAQNCIPAMKIEVIAENTNSIPFYRIEVPSGETKPYCTQGGTYKIRGNARTEALQPTQLLDIFMKIETEKFVQRFASATQDLEAILESIRANLAEKIGEIDMTLSAMQDHANYVLQNILDSTQNAENMTDEAHAMTDDVLGTAHDIEQRVGGLEQDLSYLEEKVDLLLSKFEIEDPKITRGRRSAYRMIDEFYKVDVNISEEKMFDILKGGFHFSDETLRKWCSERLAEIKSK